MTHTLQSEYIAFVRQLASTKPPRLKADQAKAYKQILAAAKDMHERLLASGYGK
jgi:hypothetical protein